MGADFLSFSFKNNYRYNSEVKHNYPGLYLMFVNRTLLEKMKAIKLITINIDFVVHVFHISVVNIFKTPILAVSF